MLVNHVISKPAELYQPSAATKDSVYPLPRRTSLVQETAATLRTWISTGALVEVLPGEMQLKDRLGVGRDTLRLALAILTKEGWVTPSSKGCQRQVQTVSPLSTGSTGKNPATDHLPVTFLSPHQVEHRLTLVEMEDTRVQLAREGRSLHFISPRIFGSKRPERQLERLVSANPSAAWILYITSEPIQRWFDENRIPAFLYELPFPGVKIPYVVPDWESAAFDAGLQLARQGHRVIGILEYEEPRPGLLAEERGLNRALNSAGIQGDLAVFKDNGSPASVARSLESAFKAKQRPTALVLTRAAQLLTCYSWLAYQGIRVPADVSLVSLPNDSWFAEFHPPLCYFQTNSKNMSGLIADRVLQLVRTGTVPQKSLTVPMKYVDGTSIGPVPRSPMQRRRGSKDEQANSFPGVIQTENSASA